MYWIYLAGTANPNFTDDEGRNSHGQNGGMESPNLASVVEDVKVDVDGIDEVETKNVPGTSASKFTEEEEQILEVVSRTNLCHHIWQLLSFRDISSSL